MGVVSEVLRLLRTSVSKPFWDIRTNTQRLGEGDSSLRPAACIPILKVLVGYKVADIICWLFGKEGVKNALRWGHQAGYVGLDAFKVRRS
jgi:hypothetical protein